MKVIKEYTSKESIQEWVTKMATTQIRIVFIDEWFRMEEMERYAEKIEKPRNR